MTGRQVRLGAILAAALVLLALGLWLVLRDQEEPRSQRRPAAGPRLSQGALVERVQASRAHVYWAGPRGGAGYELTINPSGRAFVRYLPNGVKPGDTRPDFLTVATYPLSSGVAALRRAARRTDGAQLIRLPGGALVYMNRQQPTSAYFARPGWKYQVEVYHPKPGEAMRLVLVGAVRQLK